MKATITFSQNDFQTGGIFNRATETKYHVTAKVKLTEEEQAIVHQAHLGDAVIYEYEVPLKNGMDPLHVKIDVDKCVSDGIHDVFNTPIKARQFAQKLRDDLLPTLKGYIEGNRPLDAQPIELEF